MRKPVHRPIGKNTCRHTESALVPLAHQKAWLSLSRGMPSSALSSPGVGSIISPPAKSYLVEHLDQSMSQPSLREYDDIIMQTLCQWSN